MWGPAALPESVVLAIVLKYLPLLQVAAVIVASGILSVNIARELYDTEKHTTIPPGEEEPTTFTKLKYTSVRAGLARENFRFLSNAIYLLLITLLAALFISLAVEIFIRALEFWGKRGRAAGLECLGGGFYAFLFCEFSTVARDAAEQARQGQANEGTFPVGIIMFWLLLFGAVLIVGLGVAVRTVVNIRADHSPEDDGPNLGDHLTS
jgi:hypothetical protein